MTSSIKTCRNIIRVLVTGSRTEQQDQGQNGRIKDLLLGSRTSRVVSQPRRVGKEENGGGWTDDSGAMTPANSVIYTWCQSAAMVPQVAR